MHPVAPVAMCLAVLRFSIELEDDANLPFDGHAGGLTRCW